MLCRTVQLTIQEDNQATIRVVVAGYSLALRAISKTHRGNLSSICELLRMEGYGIEYVESAKQVADFLTKPLDRVKLMAAMVLAHMRYVI